MELQDAIIQRYSCRDFSRKRVSRDDLEEILAYARHAASSCNRQGWLVKAVDDDDLKITLCKSCRVQQHYLYKAPLVLCFFYDMSQEGKDHMRAPYVSMGMFAQNIWLMLQSYGLGGMYIAGIKAPEQANHVFDIPEQYRLMGMMVVGYPSEASPVRIPRKEVNEFLSYNKDRIDTTPFNDSNNPCDWTLKQLRAFREQVLWYKGFDVDNRFRHAERYPSGSHQCKEAFIAIHKDMQKRFTMPVVTCDLLSHGGEYVLANEMVERDIVKQQYISVLGDRVKEFITQRFTRFFSSQQMERYSFVHVSGDVEEDIRIDLPDNSVDVSTNYFRTELFCDSVALLAEQARITRPNGIMYVVCRNKWFLDTYRMRKNFKKDYSLGVNWNVGPEKRSSQAEYRTALEQVGTIEWMKQINSNASIIRSLIKKKLKIDVSFIERFHFGPEVFVFAVKPYEQRK